MLKRVLFLTCLWYSAQATAQSEYDSLRAELAKVNHDTTRANIYNQLAQHFLDANPDSALFYGQQGLALSQGLPPHLRAKLTFTMGKIHLEHRTGDYGIMYFTEALGMYNALSDADGTASAHQAMGTAYEKRSFLEKAAYHFLEGCKIRRQLGDKRKLAFALNGLGLVYDKMRLYDRALACYEEGMSYLDEKDNARNMFINNMAMIHLASGENGKAKESYHYLYFHPDVQNHQRRRAMVAGNLGEAYFRLAMYDSALHYSNESLRLKQQVGPPSTVAFPAFTLAKVHQAQKSYKQALKFAQTALTVSQEHGDLENIHDASMILARVYRDMGDHGKAFEHLVKSYELRDSLGTIATVQAVNDAQIKYESEAKEWENENLRQTALINEQTIENQRTILLGVLMIIALLSIMAWMYRRQLVERKKLLRKIELQAAKLSELDAAKTRFFANISHDLRTPLSLILAAFDNIQSREDQWLEGASKEELEMGYRNAKRLLFMADEIMDLTRLEEGKLKIEFQQVKLTPYLRLLVKMFHSATDIKEISLSFQASIEEDVVVQIDPYQFEKVMYNLLSNAIKHTPPGGYIAVELEQAHTDALQLKIKDTGSGISPESLPHIFDRFYQSVTNAYKAQEGIGIGLALVKEIVELHQGYIWAESEVGQGTTFFIQLPFNARNWTSDGQVPAPSNQILSKNALWTELLESRTGLQVPGLTSNPTGATVLIVEDHKEVRAFLQSMLQSDFRVLCAANGLEALSILEKEKVEVILTDLMMPLMDGFELIDRLKHDKALRKTPVIVISARTGMDEKVSLIRKGAEDVLAKPFVKEELMARIQAALSRENWNNQVHMPFTAGNYDELEKEVLKKVEQLILKRVDDPQLSVMDIANELAASERKTYRMIRRISGLTPYDLIKEVRWQYIHQKMQTEEIKTATEAAATVGMSNATDFARQFEARFGQPLSAFLSK